MSIRIIGRCIWQNPGNRGQRLWRCCRAVAWQLDKRLLKKPRIITLPNGARMWAHPDCVVSSALIYSEWPEFHEFQFIRRRLKPDDAIVDVGANVGHVLLLLSDLVNPNHMIGFEPTPVTFGRLKENWALNGWAIGQLHQCAVGAEDGQLFIPDTPSPVTTNSLKSTRGDHEVAVDVKPLDAMGDWLGKGPVGLLKIDVEGFEPDVVRGAMVFLKSRRPRLVMFESLDGKLDPQIANCFSAAAYHVFQLDPAGQPDFVNLNAQNLFAMPNELAGKIGKMV